MHEMALAEAIFDTVAKHAEGARVARVEVRIGYFRQVVPHSLVFNWEMQTAGTELAGAELVIDHVPGVVECRSCGTSTTLEDPILLCGACDSADVSLVSGEEFLIASIDRAVVSREPS
ncbi:MAG: hydrogenase maturation nickel metallochaperone HypA [Acidimicrobiales bacterium]